MDVYGPVGTRGVGVECSCSARIRPCVVIDYEQQVFGGIVWEWRVQIDGHPTVFSEGDIPREDLSVARGHPIGSA